MQKQIVQRLILSCLLISAMLLQAKAQTKTINGTVLDDNGKPLQGATVAVKNSTISKNTDAKGAFMLSVPEGTNSLTVSYVGFEIKEVSIDGQSTISVSLVPEAAVLSNVTVVTALGFEAKKDRLGYATSRVTADQLKN